RSGADRPARPAGGGGPSGECPGRSRGGFSTKLHLAADGRCRPPALVLTPGQYGDSPQLRPVLGKIRVPRRGPGRPRTRPDSLTADKAYSSRANRCHLRRRKIRHTIPEPKDQRANRRRRGRRGGRPTGFDPEHYKTRNVVEICQAQCTDNYSLAV
ncbi:transposase, partial [Nonomuraea sp. KM90]|uniref:transposase n=1 Tax=Nonomuraea sp. KM90 TaxID=3457428 RepID=UPI003FCDFAE7